MTTPRMPVAVAASMLALAANANLDPSTLPAYRALAEHLIRKPSR